jgi:ABC-type Na+ efflux pump permease subunit
MSFQEQFQVLKDVSLGAMSIFTWLLGVLATAMLLPKDIEERTLYTILAKPVPRFEYLLGKLLGVFALLVIALLLMVGMFAIVLYTQEQTALAENARAMMPGPELDAAQQLVRNSTFQFSLIPGIAVIWLKAAVCATLTLLISTFASSSIFTIIVSVVVYIIGHVQPIAREYWLATNPAGPLTKVFLALVSLMIPDLTAFNLVDDIVAGAAVPMAMFMKTAGLGGLYITIYFFVAYFLFAGKEL